MFKLVQTTIFCLLLITAAGASAAEPEIVINEVLTNPLEAGDYYFTHNGENYVSDWVELYNPGDTDINITEYYLSDNCTEPDKWNISGIGPSGATHLMAGQHYAIWCPGYFLDTDREGNVVPIPDYMAPLKFSSGGEWIGLYKQTGADEFTLVDGFFIPPLPSDVSYGCNTDGDYTQRGYLEEPTKQTDNQPIGVLPPDIDVRSYRGITFTGGNNDQVEYTLLVSDQQPVRVRAEVTDIDYQHDHPDASDNNIAEVNLYYRVDGGSRLKLDMALSFDPREAAHGLYEAVIPGQSAGSVVEFHITAADNDGGEAALYWSTLYNPSLDSPIGFRYPVGDVGTAETAIRINEILAANTNCPSELESKDPTIQCDLGGKDSRDNADDWVELINASDGPQELGGLYLTNNELDPTRFSLLEALDRSHNVEGTALKARSHLLIWCDDETDENVSITSATENGEIHAPFTLTGDEDELLLVVFKDSNDDGVPETFKILDLATWGPGEKRDNPDKPYLGAQDGDWSLGRHPEDAAEPAWGRMLPTPGSALNAYPGGPNTGFVPYLDFKGWSPVSPVSSDTVTFTARAWHTATDFAVTLNWKSLTGGAEQNREMLDNGTAGDAAAGDGIFTAQINKPGETPPLSGAYDYWIIAEDTEGNQVRFPRTTDGRFYIGELAPPEGAVHPVITEVVAANRRCDCRLTCSCIEGEELPAGCELAGLDPFNNADDWVEIYNPGDAKIFLDKYYLSDRQNWTTRWQFPSVTLGAKERLVVWCDGEWLTEGQDPNTTSLHTNFVLDAGHDEVYLTYEQSSSERQIVDSIHFFRQISDISYGRTDQGEEGMLLSPTLEAPNTGLAAFAETITEQIDPAQPQPLKAGQTIHIEGTALENTQKIVIVHPLRDTEFNEIIYDEEDSGLEIVWDWENGMEVDAAAWSIQEGEVALTLPADLAKDPYLLCILNGDNPTWFDGGVAWSSLPFEIGEASGEPLFIRGDANQDGALNLADAVSILTYLFAEGAMNCPDAGDVNDDGAENIADAVFILTYLFANGEKPSAPFDTCGEDPTDDELPRCIYTGC